MLRCPMSQRFQEILHPANVRQTQSRPSMIVPIVRESRQRVRFLHGLLDRGKTRIERDRIVFDCKIRHSGLNEGYNLP